MTTGGLTSQGFIALTVEEIVTDTGTAVLATIDPTMDLSPDQPIGELIGVNADREASAWEAMATIVAAYDPNSADDALLDNVAAITGTYRQEATFSTVVGTLSLQAGITVLAGAQAWVQGQASNLWTLQADVHNPSGITAPFPGTFISNTSGPNVANAGTLNQYTAASGWLSLTNAANAILGLAEDTNTTLRIKRVEELAAAGSGTTAAITADVAQDTGVLAVRTFDNDNNFTDAFGVPPHGVHVIIWDGASPLASNDVVAQTIWDSRAAGTPTYGSQSGTAIDYLGASRTVFFDRATPVFIYINISGTATTADQVVAIKSALVAYGASFVQGQTVVIEALRSVVWALGIFTATPSFTIGTTFPASSTSDITVTQLHIAQIKAGLDPTNLYITVNGT